MNAPKKRGQPAKEIGGGNSPLATASSPVAAVSSATPTSGGHPRNAPEEQTKSYSTSENNSCWRTVRLSDYADTCLGKMLDQNKNRGDYYPYLGNSDVRWGTFELDNLSTMRFEKDEHDRYGLEYGDLVVCEGGEPGRCAIWKSEVSGMKFQKALHRIRPKSELDNTFLFYWFLRVGQTKEIESFFTGTTIKHLTGQALKALQIPLPPLPIQKRIAHILGTLDDKIALNRRINQTLEAMAQALFQSWFVDFDPVKAKQQALEASGTAQAAELAAMQVISGKSPAQLKAFQKQQPEQYAELERTAKLFPSKLVESELGLIPEGWEVKALDQCYNLVMGQSPPGTSYNETGEGSAFYQGRTDFGFRFPSNRIFTTAPTRFAKKLDTLVSVRAPVGDVNMAKEECCLGRGLAAVRHKTNAYSLTFYQMLNLKPIFNSFESEGTVFGSINKVSFENIRTLSFPKKLIVEFEKKVNPVDSIILMNSIEIDSLTSTRDSLLPKLLSGEIDISNINVVGNK